MAHVDADRNLLFGLLALQNNFIDRDGLLDAFSRWVHDRRGAGVGPEGSRGRTRFLVFFGRRKERNQKPGLTPAHVG
jgi:hypothetical protein